ncbi:TrlF family AAA-like ATPase [Pseudomonas sp. 10S4]|uniref:TrlF family AAA-like ATPase n=1 Tax=Pseudomonas sp. 10S4 TaxID=3048583 RepID=UPI002AC8D593|nr:MULTISPECIES: AAA family ATPase [unclassified Pseudomonas]MEB0222908.1 AAA family ATPase [Pseudomonas sp. 5S1]MEB0293047.1 AAA family ATPase [Pseudomonas sp. 10S4]WPX17213.1 AAA family ATPase [Pseudomonas sp. 10S4]
MPVILQGSTWKKWDLHVHTPESLVHHYPGEKEAAWEAFLDDLERLPAEFKVLGINDYLFVDGYARVLEERRKGRLANIELVLPVVELRLDKFGGILEQGEEGYKPSSWSRINLHVVFDEVDPQLIREQFMPAISQGYSLVPESPGGRWAGVITKVNLIDLGERVLKSMPEALRAGAPSALKVGFNNLNVSFEAVRAALKTQHFDGKHIIALGKSEWDSLRWNDHTIADKKTIINDADLVFTAAANPEAYLKARNGLKAAQVNARLLDCSDAHSLSTSKDKDRVGNCFTWIKADSTFQGLLQAIHEFDDRVYVGDAPPKQKMIEQSKTKFISSIKVSKVADSALPEPWFDLDIPLNPDLVAIIGNKGSGKSALSDVIALVGNTKHHAKFSFLKNTRFRSPKRKFAENFIGALTWLDGSVTQRSLQEDPEPSSVERVKYLPQSYLEDLCNELGEGGSSTFDAELRKIIYSHVPEEERLGKASMDELLEFKVAEIEKARKGLRESIGKINAEIIEAERRSTKDFLKSLQEQLAAKQGELAALNEAQPQPVLDPSVSPEALAETKQAAEQVAVLEGEGRKIEGEEAALKTARSVSLKREAVAKRISTALVNYGKQHAAFLGDLKVLMADLDVELPIDSLVTMRVDTGPVDAIAAAAQAQVKAIDIDLGSEEQGSILQRKALAASQLVEAKSKLGEAQRLYVVYRENLASWERAKAELIGAADKPGSLVQLQAEIELLADLPAQQTVLRAERFDKACEMHGLIQSMVDEFSRLYLPVQRFVNSEEQRELNLPLDFQVRIEETGFADQLLKRINQRVRGSFMGVDESSQMLRNLLLAASFETANEAVAFADAIDDLLHFDRREGQPEKQILLADQLARTVTAQELLDYLYCLDYLAPRYSLTYEGQEIGQLSPGERGLLLLVFYLLVDEDDIPIVIDQPEENLDNQTIFRVMVKCIKRAKERRQVIMVTHNPNLAVVCDAEQIIHAACDKAASRFDYEAGAIEHPDIKARVVEILEGTEPAFKNRQGKYRLQ